MFLLYNILLTIFAPIWVPWMWWRASRRKDPPDWKQRFGDYDLLPSKGVRRVWIHAVSVGEVIAAIPILRELRLALPEHEVVLSVTTSSGHATALDKASEWIHHLVYFPIDVARFQLAAMSRVRPEVVAIMETELWFNFLWAARAVGSKTLLVNGRISDRSFPRSMRLRFFYRALLSMLDQALMQSRQDADRILALGAKCAEVMGNTKFDQAADAQGFNAADARREFSIPEGAFVVVVGSTRSEFEEDLVTTALASPELEGAFVVHAPRHVERAESLAAAYRSKLGEAALRSKGEFGRVLILDTYGELHRVYAAADVVVIGGGFSDLGGQNLLQPLAMGKPVLHGPHMQNFAEVTSAALERSASEVCATAAELLAALSRLRNNPAERERRSTAARALIASNLGASRRYAKAIRDAAESTHGPLGAQ